MCSRRHARTTCDVRAPRRPRHDGRRVPFRADSVILDPDFLILRWDSSAKQIAKRTAPLTRADFERRFGSAKRALELYTAALDTIAEPDRAGLRFSMSYDHEFL